MENLKVDNEFKNLLPPLTEDEYSQLESDIKKHGVLSPIIAWNGFIIDGHNRYEICRKNGIDLPEIKALDFSNKSDVMDWIINHQTGRRNLTKSQLVKAYASVEEQLKREERTTILYEAPHHLRGTLQELYDSLGDRKITLCRELTKKFEEALPMTLESAIVYYSENEPRGEYVLVMAGADRAALEEEKRVNFEEMSLEEHMAMYTDQGLSRKEAMKKVAADRGVSKRDIYKELL